MSERLFFGTISCGGVRFGVRKAIFRHHFLWRDEVRCQKGYLSAPFLVAKYGSVSERVSFCTIFCGVSISVSERVSFGTITCGGVRFGVRKAIFRHHFLWRVGICAAEGYFLHKVAHGSEDCAADATILHKVVQEL